MDCRTNQWMAIVWDTGAECDGVVVISVGTLQACKLGISLAAQCSYRNSLSTTLLSLRAGNRDLDHS